MFIHEAKKDVRGAGNWEMRTGRYIPLSGGSRSRLPVGFENSRRYHGFVGMDEALTPSMGTLHELYHYLGGGIHIPEGPAGEYISLLVEQSKKWIRAEPNSITE